MNEKEAEQLGEELKRGLQPYMDSFRRSMEEIFEQNDKIVDHLLKQQNTLALAVANLASGSKPGARMCMKEFEDRAFAFPRKLEKGHDDG